jgi:hypothetical protein
MPSPLRLTDAQLSAIWSAAAPLAPQDRDPFVRAVGQVLQERREVGDGDVHRAIRELQRRHFDPPDLTDGRAQPHSRNWAKAAR